MATEHVMEKNPVKREHVIVLVTLGAAVLLWELLSIVAFARLSLIFPSTVDIAGAVYELVGSEDFAFHFLETAKAVGAATGLAIVSGITLGTLIGYNEFISKAVEPLLYYFSSVPKIVLYPLLLIAFGIGLESKIAIGFLSAMFPITVNAIVGTANIQQNFVQVGKSYNATTRQLFTKVYLPSTAIYHINGTRLGIGVAIISILLAELFASQAGVGNQINFYFNNLHIARMYGILVIVFVTSFALNTLLLLIESHLKRKGYYQAEEGDSAGF